MKTIQSVLSQDYGFDLEAIIAQEGLGRKTTTPDEAVPIGAGGGSGALIGPKLMVTTRHVVRDRDSG